MSQKIDMLGLEKIFQAVNEYNEKNQQMIQQFLQPKRQHIFDNAIGNALKAWQEFTMKALKKPDKLIFNQLNYWQNYMSLCKELSENIQKDIEKNPANLNSSNDRRFQNEEWEKNYIFNFIKQSYLLMADHINSLVKEIVGEEEKRESRRIEFYIQQFIDAISPTNFITTNPEVLQATLSTKGENLITGFKEFLEDFKNGDGLFNIKTTDVDFFKIGKNIAATSGKIIYQNDIMQLIQYLPLTPKVNQYPLLVIPPWINKYYILDLQPENSFVRWLLEQGQTVFLISWVNPDSRHAAKQFSDYLLEGPLTALRVIEQITGEQKINSLGYCIGGTLLACTLAYLHQQKQYPILSATFLTTLLDFSIPGDLGIFIDEQQVSELEKLMAERGFLDGHVLMSTFSMLRANDLIWKNFVNNYLKGKKPAPFDLLYWNSDPTNIPEKVHSFYLREMYLNNRLIQPNALKLAGVPIDLSKINVPSYFLAALDDHIVPWRSCYQGLEFMGGPKKFVLTDSGHVAGVINSPNKNKYGYRTNDQLATDALGWLNNATHLSGSWWSNWHEWLFENFSGKKIPARKITKKSKVIEDAPGSYALQRINQKNE